MKTHKRRRVFMDYTREQMIEHKKYVEKVFSKYWANVEVEQCVPENPQFENTPAFVVCIDNSEWFSVVYLGSPEDEFNRKIGLEYSWVISCSKIFYFQESVTVKNYEDLEKGIAQLMSKVKDNVNEFFKVYNEFFDKY